MALEVTSPSQGYFFSPQAYETASDFDIADYDQLVFFHNPESRRKAKRPPS